MKTWRDAARPIIANVIREHGREDTPELRKALFDAYPFGQRKYWPYQVWLDEIKVQLGTKKKLQSKRAKKKQHKCEVPKDQLKLF